MDKGRFGLGLGSFIGHLLRPTNAAGGVEVTVIQGWLRSDANFQSPSTGACKTVIRKDRDSETPIANLGFLVRSLYDPDGLLRVLEGLGGFYCRKIKQPWRAVGALQGHFRLFWTSLSLTCRWVPKTGRRTGL